jgi:hypothetical protein
MKLYSFPTRRIEEIGVYLAEFALEFFPIPEDPKDFDTNSFSMFLETWYDRFLRYAETNRMITRDEIWMLNENINRLDEFIKEAAVNTARELAAKRPPSKLRRSSLAHSRT